MWNSRNWWVLAQIELLESWSSGAERVRRLARGRSDESGQATTEYLMIVGIMAALIIVVFVTFFWDSVRLGASAFVDRVKGALLGTDIR